MSSVTRIEQRSAQNAEIDAILRHLTTLRGVTAAAVVDRDGLVTHIRKDFEIETDALGASVQIVFGAASKAAKHVEQNVSKIVICENDNGYILLAPLKSDFIIALVGDRNALLGTIRFELKETIPELNVLFSDVK
ncbi:MAG: roadblock/LC7 domain-containing protein [Methylococcales bacterium]